MTPQESVTIVEVSSKKLLHRFIEYPHQLYKNCKQYVPQLNMVQHQLLSPKSNPFFHHGEVACFLAIDHSGNIVGRIAAIFNKAHLALYKDETGFFGLFDCINDSSVASLLLNKAAEWLKVKGLRRMIGPENLTTNDSVGILTTGFDNPPVFMMPYNYPYYQQLLESNSMLEEMTLYSYHVEHTALPGDVYEKSKLLEGRLFEKGIKIRPLNLKKFDAEMDAMQQLYNDSNVGNWGFLPLDKVSFLHMARDIRQLIKPGHLLFAEKDNKLIGFALTVPDYNQVFAKIPDGKLFPFGWYYLLRSKDYITRFRIMILGILPAYRGLGIDWCLYAHTAVFTEQCGLGGGEACYVMKENQAMNKMMQRLGGKIVKEYKLYSRAI